MNIKLLNQVSWGGNPLAPIVYSALRDMNIKYDIELIESDNLFEDFGIKNTPAMIINGNVVLEGHIPSIITIKDIINDNLI